MGPKKRAMSIELKREIIEKHEQGVRVVDLARMYERSTSMICTVLKQKELLKSITPAKGVAIISKLRSSVHDEMEKILLEWMAQEQFEGTTLTQSIICEKARAIYDELLNQMPNNSTSGEPEDSFKASRGWFDNFKRRTGIQSVAKHGEAASSNMKAAEDYFKFSDLIHTKGYIPQQVFKCDENSYVNTEEQELIKDITPAKRVTIIPNLQSSIHEELEKLLMVWMIQKQTEGTTLTQSAICEKARTIYDELLNQIPHTSTTVESEDSFRDIRGWFDKFENRTGHGEGANSNMKTAEDCINKFSDVTHTKGYIPQQVFKCDETELFWKRLPNRTYITIEEKSMPGYHPMNDRLTLALCANASGDYKIKPLLVYHSEDPTAFKTHRILKEKLNVMWKAHPKAWVTRKIFVEWINLVFGPSVKKYLLENNLPVQALLVLDNGRAHLSNLEDDLQIDYKFIEFFYLPPNTSPILQPFNKQVIFNFKMLYIKHILRRCFDVTDNTNLTLREFWKNHFNIVICLKIINQAWQDVTTRTLTSAWKKLWPEIVGEMAFEEFKPEAAVVEEIVSLGKSMGLEVDEKDLNDLVEEQSQESTVQELDELHLQQQVKQENISEDEQEMENVMSTEDIKEILEMWNKIEKFVDKNHPEKVATARASELFNETCLTHFRNIMSERNTQCPLDSFIKCEDQ
ncbi:tigger transposable element-derived protein 1-like [Ctenocephalides felis]|uniref:tigger transposable element-derived protein 1-like n=1 Tax=Ctenocephalides felis TaxID=7515 RepID=UPI000E6E1490|nr:tigger transposable element-derived protein 1-like [Ctenocephalides felis]